MSKTTLRKLVEYFIFPSLKKLDDEHYCATVLTSPRFCICQFAYVLMFTWTLWTGSAVTVTHGHVHSGEKFKSPDLHGPS